MFPLQTEMNTVTSRVLTLAHMPWPWTKEQHQIVQRRDHLLEQTYEERQENLLDHQQAKELQELIAYNNQNTTNCSSTPSETMMMTMMIPDPTQAIQDRSKVYAERPIPTSNMTPTPTTTTWKPMMSMTNWFHRLKDKNLTTLNRIKYDSELLLHYLYDGSQPDTDGSPNYDINIIKICKMRVRRTCGTLLAHYYATIELSNGYKFEFHPGSQPRTFQQIHSDGHLIILLVYCDECCKNELRSFVEGENGFNVAFHNCESILCKRQSMQTVFITLALVAITYNVFKFTWYCIFFVLFILLMLYLNNNYILSSPRVIFCPHKRYLS
ncbi:ac81 [Hemileuca sp. nucleopolyhedrovirus]|uniref:Ac81 n=1 Tax=Hemileuca sp. nucleopolyhedrovirus TaxID=1367203 RepID=S5N384_9ABAC|nr:ac81 [Hemileuca sp. nucleopolyhedrovirus]AGR56825.1 ac81 [Hemileuca sp. nucleopolyhedrovirus]